MVLFINEYDQMDIHMLLELYRESNIQRAREIRWCDKPSDRLDIVEDEFLEYLRTDFFASQGAFYAVWQERDLYVSALRVEPFDDGVLVEAVETHPQYRRKGFAKRLIKEVLAMVDKKYPVYSHVHKNNTASVGLHISCGFQYYLPHAKYIDGTITSNAYTMKY